MILQIIYGESFKFTNHKIKKTGIVHPVLVKLKLKPEIELDWEHTKFKWVQSGELNKYDTVPKLDIGLLPVLSNKLV
jgi:hypothetical protein